MLPVNPLRSRLARGACQAQGKWPGPGGVYTEELLRRHVGRGMRLVLGATDLALMLDAARDRSAMLRRCGAAARRPDA